MSVSKSERILNAIQKRTGLTEAGKNWLMASIDPFHDNQFRVDGFPDATSSPSVTQCVKQSITVNVPGSVGATANWDCMVCLYPFLNQVGAITETDIANGAQSTFTTGIPTHLVGGLAIYADLTGRSLGPGDTNPTNTSYLELPANYWAGKHRVIGMAFEVHNTTADINKQGAVTVWKSPIPDFDTASCRQRVTQSTGGNIAYIDTLSFATPPSTTAQALLLAGAREWDAREGAYVVSTFNNLDVPADQDDGRSFRITSPLYTPNTSICEALSTLTIGSANLVTGSAAYKCWTKMDMSGCTFTGLSNASTLLINLNVYIERFPDQTVPDLVVLAYPSPPFDPVAQEIYTAVMNDMPVGVMVKENGLGDWFAGAIQKASAVIGPVLSMMPHPAAKAAGAAMSLVAPGNTFENSNGKGVVQRVKSAVQAKVKQVSKAVANSKGKK